MNLVLIGYRGTGKSTVARHLGLALGWGWIDADVELELRAGRSISEIFAEGGEEAFRDLESDVLASFQNSDQTVLALGGGVILRPQNREILAGLGKVVWLKAQVATIVQRLAADASTAGRRPNLTTNGGQTEIETLLQERTPLYKQAAHMTVVTDGRSPAAIAAEILDRLQLQPGARQA